MKTNSTKATKTAKKRKSIEKNMSPLAICPVGGAGWCAYPFSVDQLEKRLKRTQEQDQTGKQLATSGNMRSQRSK